MRYASITYLILMMTTYDNCQAVVKDNNSISQMAFGFDKFFQEFLVTINKGRVGCYYPVIF